MTANYTWSHEIDQGAAGGGDSDYPGNPACLACERASGDYDARQVFTANAVYDMPFRSGGSALSSLARLVHAAFGNWSLSPIVTARTCLPINATEDRSSTSVATGYTTSQRPNRVPGVSLSPPGGPQRGEWINPAAFSLVAGSGYGDAPRNVARGPGLWQADLALSKQVHLSESAQLRFRCEFFNAFNRAQYGLPLSDFSTSSFGQILNTVNTGPVSTGTPRQIQLSVRLQF
ncbi:MAG: hypothetical protein WCC26_22000 [Terracidiphilus sp.]